MAPYRDSDGPVFDHRPTGEEIGQWFRDEAFARRYENVGGDAVLLWRVADLYPYGTLHKLAEVDHDDQMFYLLEVGHNPSEERASTHDLLFITAGLREPLACSWRGGATERQPWGRDGLLWFVEKIEEAEDRQQAEYERARAERGDGCPRPAPGVDTRPPPSGGEVAE